MINMERIYIEQLSELKGTEVEVFGWVHIRRDHGKLIFLDLRDTTGKVQMVALPEHEGVIGQASKLRSEWVVKIKGKVNERPDRMKKEEINGDIEIEILGIEIINEAKTPAFEVSMDTINVDEEVRGKYKYLDLRTDRLHENIKMRSKYVQAVREYLFENKFTEIETPYLTQATPEGSRDFVVPSRLNPGEFYALPQSPQQYKQLLMNAGFDRYFQTARCFRDEDLRADRGFEHTQIDMEMSFVNQEELMNTVEEMTIKVAEKLGKKIKEVPFPRVTYKDSMEKYGDDKFDLRTEEDKEDGVLAYAWVIDFPFFEKTDDGKWTFTHNPFSMPKEKDIEKLMKGEDVENIIAQQYDLVCNGYEAGGGSVRAHKPEILEATYKVMGYSNEEIKESIGHILEAFTYGTPPHAGIALGVERQVMNIVGETALREVQAFPTTGGGKTSVMNGPSELPKEVLEDLSIMVTKKKDKE